MASVILRNKQAEIISSDLIAKDKTITIASIENKVLAIISAKRIINENEIINAQVNIDLKDE